MRVVYKMKVSALFWRPCEWEHGEEYWGSMMMTIFVVGENLKALCKGTFHPHNPNLSAHAYCCDLVWR